MRLGGFKRDSCLVRTRGWLIRNKFQTTHWKYYSSVSSEGRGKQASNKGLSSFERSWPRSSDPNEVRIWQLCCHHLDPKSGKHVSFLELEEFDRFYRVCYMFYVGFVLIWDGEMSPPFSSSSSLSRSHNTHISPQSHFTPFFSSVNHSHTIKYPSSLLSTLSSWKRR